jgi:hypothetical protein
MNVSLLLRIMQDARPYSQQGLGADKSFPQRCAAATRLEDRSPKIWSPLDHAFFFNLQSEAQQDRSLCVSRMMALAVVHGDSSFAFAP